MDYVDIKLQTPQQTQNILYKRFVIVGTKEIFAVWYTFILQLYRAYFVYCATPIN